MYIVPSFRIFVNMEILFTRTFRSIAVKNPYLFTLLEVLSEVTLNMRLRKIVP